MFEVKDRDNKSLFIHDKVVHNYKNEMLEEISIKGIIIAFPEEGKVQYSPIGEGLPTICDGSELLQTDSLAQRAMQLKTKEDFQELIRMASERYAESVENSKKKKAGTRGKGKKAAPEVVNVQVVGGEDF